ncbi:MAG: hypothetical protein WAM81_00730 [Acidimicrobiia bacterium]
MKKLLLVVVLVLSACSSGGTTETTSPTDDESTDTQATTTPQADQTTTTSAAEQPASSSSSGHITLTIGDQTWEFDGALCAYTDATPGEAGSQWNVSMVQDDLQVYVNDDSTGRYISVANIKDYGTFQWEAHGDAVTVLTVDGNDIIGEGTFSDMAGDGPATEGSVTATCPSWLKG